jgi:hypothetical protein
MQFCIGLLLFIRKVVIDDSIRFIEHLYKENDLAYNDATIPHRMNARQLPLLLEANYPPSNHFYIHQIQKLSVIAICYIARRYGSYCGSDKTLGVLMHL